MGSSAAVAVALVRSLFAFYGRKADPAELLALAHIAETFAHGTPSGIDAAAVSADCPLWFCKGEKPQTLPLGAALHLVIADSGRKSDTRSAVQAVKERLRQAREETKEHVNRLETMAVEARSVLSRGDCARLGELLDSAQDALNALGVSDDGLNRLVNAARDAGALGAKLTGGGRGGCMLALAPDGAHAARVSRALKRAGASNTWYFELGERVEK